MWHWYEDMDMPALQKHAVTGNVGLRPNSSAISATRNTFYTLLSMVPRAADEIGAALLFTASFTHYLLCHTSAT